MSKQTMCSIEDFQQDYALHTRYLQDTTSVVNQMHMQDRIIYDVDLSDLDLRNAVFINCTFVGLNFNWTLLLDVTFIECQFDSCTFFETLLKQTTFQSCIFRQTSFMHCHLNELTFENTQWVEPTFHSSHASDTKGLTLITLPSIGKGEEVFTYAVECDVISFHHYTFNKKQFKRLLKSEKRLREYDLCLDDVERELLKSIFIVYSL